MAVLSFSYDIIARDFKNVKYFVYIIGEILYKKRERFSLAERGKKEYNISRNKKRGGARYGAFETPLRRLRRKEEKRKNDKTRTG
jgi:hypothetical protein